MSYFTREGGILSTPHPRNVGVQPTFWLDALDTDPLNFVFNGADVALWKDKSGNGETAIQSIVLEQPEFISNGLNGRPTVRWVHAGAAMGLEISGGLPIGLNGDRTLFMVINPTSGFGNSEVFGIDTGNRIDFAGDFISIRQAPRLVDSLAGTVPQNIPTIITITDRQGSLVNDMNVYNGSTQILTNTLSAFSWAMNVNLGIGKSLNVGSRSYHGDISEIIMYPVILSTANRLRILAYLTAKWGF